MKILILGKHGWLGGIFYDYLTKKGIEATSRHEDINSITELDTGTDVVVNFAASATIDWCEKNKYRTFWNNVLGAVNIAQVCKASNAKYVFISSACVLGSKDENDIKYEDDRPTPHCFYTETKMMAERLIQEIIPDALIARIRLVISETPHPRNILDKLVTYKKLVNCQESVTVVEDLIPQLLKMIQKDETGIAHLVNEGTISPSEIGKLMGHKFEIYTKQDLDKQISAEGKAPRISTIIGSRRGYLPPIKDRIVDITNKWKEKRVI